MVHLQMIYDKLPNYLSNMVIFHGYVKLPEGNLWWGEGGVVILG